MGCLVSRDAFHLLWLFGGSAEAWEGRSSEEGRKEGKELSSTVSLSFLPAVTSCITS